MHLARLIQQAEELVFLIGQQAPYEKIQVPARTHLQELYALNNQTKQDDKPSNDEEIHLQKAERKLALWAANYQDSIPAKILITFLCIKKEYRGAAVTRANLEFFFQSQFAMTNSPQHDLELAAKFDSNYQQMKNFGEKNHAKIFEVRPDGIITIWPPVQKYVQEFARMVL